MKQPPAEMKHSAPAWARWIAQDLSGVWWAYEDEPNQGDLSWYENEVGRYQRLGDGEVNPDWKSALFRVPR